MATEYIPGVCNIGPNEIKMRLWAGWFFLAATLFLIGIFYYIPMLYWWRLGLFFPAFISALGFFQAGFHFCVSYGSKGLFNVSSETGKTESVSQQEFRKKDQRNALVIVIYSALVGFVVAACALLV
jgi:hypothetical protein